MTKNNGNKAGYTLTNHATDRVILRAGVAADRVESWVNDTMRKAKYVTTTQQTLVYEYDGLRYVVNPDKRVIITVKPAVDASFLAPVMEREERKAKRMMTRQVRELELRKAYALKDIGECAVNKAKARNPKTQEHIQRNINELQAKVRRYEMDIAKVGDDFEGAKRALAIFV